jgi:hypothetical protein
MSTRDWFNAERSPRDFAAAILAMNDKALQRKFFDEKVPEHLQDLVMRHVMNALAVGGKK